MSTAEIVTAVLSVLALVVSFATLYLTYFHKKVEVIGVLAEYWVDEPTSLVGVVLDFAFSNTGNKDVLIRKAIVELRDRPGAMVPELDCRDLPAIIKPDRVALVKIEVPQLFLRNAARTQTPVVVSFEVFGPGATQYVLSKVLEQEGQDITFTLNTFKPFRLEKVRA